MFNPTELFIGLRYLRARRRNRFLSFISGLSIIGIALGVLSLITVISIMNGFQAELRDRLLGMASHVIISKNDGVFDYDLVRSKIHQVTTPAGMAPFIESDVMIGYEKNISPANLRGIDLDKEDQVSTLTKNITAGDIKKILTDDKTVAIGIELADQLELSVGDTVSLIVPLVNEKSGAITPRVEPFKVVAIFRANIHRYDSTMVITSIAHAKKFLHLTGYERGERILLPNMDDAFAVQKSLAVLLPKFTVRDWADMHASFFTAIKIEKIAMFAILLLIITVAAFNIVSTMAMGVAEKQSDIAILKTIGASSSKILKIFLLQGAIIGILGTAIGCLGGIIVANNISSWIASLEDFFGAKVFNPEVFYVSEIPSVMLWSDVSLVTGFSLVISVLATIYPAVRASGTHPALALRYE
ncbi:MAG: lipoprotein-releasing ABC transporter permease subunit [Gammaproteobacteria bacterium]|nr:MAG: lipoprotein-releasing ABC transporter permease subunit [Gammaproteobacteria bacterium]